MYGCATSCSYIFSANHILRYVLGSLLVFRGLLDQNCSQCYIFVETNKQLLVYYLFTVLCCCYIVNTCFCQRCGRQWNDVVLHYCCDDKWLINMSLTGSVWSITDVDVVVGVGCLSPLCARVCVCVCVCVSETKTTGLIITKLCRWTVLDKFWWPILLEVKRSNVRVGVSLHSSEC